MKMGMTEPEGNEDIFNNEAMENPFDEDEDNDDGVDSVQFEMLAERGTSGPSVQEKEDEDETARFPLPAQNPANGIVEEA